eukprot:2624456-Rhodomonas_salina.2
MWRKEKGDWIKENCLDIFDHDVHPFHHRYRVAGAGSSVWNGVYQQPINHDSGAAGQRNGAAFMEVLDRARTPSSLSLAVHAVLYMVAVQRGKGRDRAENSFDMTESDRGEDADFCEISEGGKTSVVTQTIAACVVR